MFLFISRNESVCNRVEPWPRPLYAKSSTLPLDPSTPNPRPLDVSPSTLYAQGSMGMAALRWMAAASSRRRVAGRCVSHQAAALALPLARPTPSSGRDSQTGERDTDRRCLSTCRTSRPRRRAAASFCFTANTHGQVSRSTTSFSRSERSGASSQLQMVSAVARGRCRARGLLRRLVR